MHCYTEVAAGKARLDYDSSLLASNKLSKNKPDARDLGRDGKDDAGQNNVNDY